MAANAAVYAFKAWVTVGGESDAIPCWRRDAGDVVVGGGEGSEVVAGLFEGGGFAGWVCCGCGWEVDIEILERYVIAGWETPKCCPVFLKKKDKGE